VKVFAPAPDIAIDGIHAMYHEVVSLRSKVLGFGNLILIIIRKLRIRCRKGRVDVLWSRLVLSCAATLQR